VLNADKILVLEHGRVAASGTHAELMESSPTYAEIYHSQLVGDAPAVPPTGATEARPPGGVLPGAVGGMPA
jgi:ATP-binding cassette subfamily B protein